MKYSVQDIKQQVDLSVLWFKDNQYLGYDPYDFKGLDLYVRLFGQQNIIFRKIRGIMNLIEYNIPPLLLRKMFNVKKTINAKGMGLLASSYLSLYRKTKNSLYLSDAEKVLDWLYENKNINHIIIIIIPG